MVILKYVTKAGEEPGNDGNDTACMQCPPAIYNIDFKSSSASGRCSDWFPWRRSLAARPAKSQAKLQYSEQLLCTLPLLQQ